MRLRSNRQLTSSTISIESSIENYSSESEIDQEEVDMLKKEMTEILEAEPINNVNSENQKTNNILYLESYSDSEDSDYIPNKSKETKILKNISKYFIFTDEDKTYFSNLNDKEKESIITLKDKIENTANERKPSLFKILECKLPLESKIEILKKYKESRLMDKSATEFYKLQDYINGILNIPFNKYNDLKITNTSDYILNAKQTLDSIIYGHERVKLHILEILGQYISAPKSIGNVFGIYGPMGIGKTTIIKDGLSKVLQRPFNFITLGGASDSSFLDGHSYTYEGSKPGKIVECLIKSKCMNPIFYFDELDKISKTPKGEEITNLLIHLTDDSQNNRFQDKYYSGIDINISRAIFVFSFNNISAVNPILRDRLNIIKLDGFNNDAKLTISKKYLIKHILKEFDADDIVFTCDALNFIIQNYSNEQGVRELKRKIKDIVSKINLMKLSKNVLFSSEIVELTLNSKPIKITSDIAKKLLQ